MNIVVYHYLTQAIHVIMLLDYVDLGDHSLAEWTKTWRDKLELYL